MLEAIRAHTGSFVVKLLFILLIISFGAWGIGDIIRTGVGNTSVATVGKAEISPTAFSDTFSRELRRLQSMFGTQIDREQAKAMGIPNAVLGRMVNDALLSQEADRLGLMAGDDAIRRRIHENPEFFNSQRQFDPSIFGQVIRSNGYDEPTYVSQMRRELRRAQITDSLVGGDPAPKPLVEALYRHRMEQRVAKIFTVRDDSITDVPAPDADTVKKYHDEHPELFSSPEYRAVTVAQLDAKALAKDIKIPDEDVRAAFDQRQGDFAVPEHRKLEHLVVSSEDKAQDALKRLRSGEDFPTVAKDVANMDPGALEIGDVTRDQLLPEMADAAFGAPDGGYTEPVKSPLGWHVIKVVSVSPARDQTFEEVRDQLRTELANEKAVDALYSQANKFEDALGGGASLEDASAQIGLQVRKIPAIDREGKDADGKPVADLPPSNNFLNLVFETSEGADTSLTEAGNDAYFIARVDKVTPPALKPLESVEQEVIHAWTAEQQEQKAKEKAEALVQKIKDGLPIEDLAKSAGAEVKSTDPFRRDDRRSPLPPDIMKAMFSAHAGDPAMARGNNGFMVAVLSEVKPANPATDPDGLKSFGNSVADTLRNDMLTGFAFALRDTYPVRVNPKALENF